MFTQKGSEGLSTELWFDELYITFYPKLLNITLRLTEDSHLAEDIVQSAFTTLYERRKELISHHNIQGWLVVTVKNKLQSEMQKLNYTQEVPLMDGIKLSYDPENKASFNDLLPATLSESDRLILDLHYRQGYSHSEIGKYLGCSETACRMRLCRIVAKCRKLSKNEKF